MIKHNLPQGWEVKTLGEIFLIERGGSPRPIKEYLTTNLDGINWIKIGDTKNITKYITKTAQKIKPEGKKHSRFVEIGDLILSNSMSFGKPYIMKTTGCIHDGWVVFKQSKKVIDEEFCYYVLSSSEIYAQFDKLATGSTVKNLNIERIKQIQIPLPLLETQQKIVAKPESEFAKIESAKSHLEKAKETIPRLKNSLLKSAFNGELTQPCKDEKGTSHCHCEDSLESEAIYNAESPLKDSIAESKAYKIVDCHELRCNSRKDKSVAQTPNFTQSPNLGCVTLVAQNLQGDINSLGCHSEALAEESQNIKPHKDSTLKDISATPQYDKTTSFYHADFPSCHSDLECNEREESKRYFANAQYDETASFCHSEGDKPEESHIADSNRDISHFSNTQYDKENNLPQGWEIKTLRDILSSDKYAIKRGPFGSMLKKEFFVDSGIRVFEQYNPINQDSNWKRYFVTQQKFKELESFKAGAGDLLISCSGTLGKILELPKGVEVGIINQALLKIRLDDKQILNSYFVYLFNSPYMQKIILENTIGSAIQNIASVKTLKQIQIPIPPLEIQKQIVEILDSKFAALENLEKETNASLEKLQKLKSSLLNLAFKGELIC